MRKDFQYSDYIHCLDDLPQGQPVVLLCRVSGKQQYHDKNLDDQEANLRAALGDRRILKVFNATRRARDLNELKTAIAYCRRHGAVLLTETLDRLVRHVDYDPKRNFKFRPTLEQMEELARLADGVRLFTLVHPDAPHGKVRSCQTKRGQRHKDRKGGGDRMPGWKKRRRKMNLPRVLGLRRRGRTYQQIADVVNVPKLTVRSWIIKYG